MSDFADGRGRDIPSSVSIQNNSHPPQSQCRLIAGMTVALFSDGLLAGRSGVGGGSACYLPNYRELYRTQPGNFRHRIDALFMGTYHRLLMRKGAFPKNLPAGQHRLYCSPPWGFYSQGSARSKVSRALGIAHKASILSCSPESRRAVAWTASWLGPHSTEGRPYWPYCLSCRTPQLGICLTSEYWPSWMTMIPSIL